MPLIRFVQDNQEQIIREFSAFAKTLMPAGADMSEVELRDHAAEILAAITADMALPQSAEEQSRKSEGHGSAHSRAASGKSHADDRIGHGFTFQSVLAEFRALRATVLRLYEESGKSDLFQVRRFNEALDEALTESMDRFAVQTDLFRDQFIGILCHDLRTPLNAISVGAALLAKPDDDPQRRQRVTAGVLSSAERMKRMITDLLDLTQVRLGGTIPLNVQQADLQSVCAEVIAETRAAWPAVAIELKTSGNLQGKWDPDRLGQVVSNLLANAITHGGETPVSVIVGREGEAVTIAIHNGGVPIPRELLPRIFEPLARGGGKYGGWGHSIGLGLFIVRAVVLAHGGDIQVRSSADRGTTFTVSLPTKR
jgi:signal transduction histidine kinase